jgi:hypothetical protein
LAPSELEKKQKRSRDWKKVTAIFIILFEIFMTLLQQMLQSEDAGAYITNRRKKSR